MPAAAGADCELDRFVETFAGERDRGEASGWDTGTTETGDPQFYLLGPPPDHDCILCVSRLGKLYVLEDGAGHLVFENADFELLARQAKPLLKAGKDAAAGAVAAGVGRAAACLRGKGRAAADRGRGDAGALRAATRRDGVTTALTRAPDDVVRSRHRRACAQSLSRSRACPRPSARSLAALVRSAIVSACLGSATRAHHIQDSSLDIANPQRNRSPMPASAKRAAARSPPRPPRSPPRSRRKTGRRRRARQAAGMESGRSLRRRSTIPQVKRDLDRADRPRRRVRAGLQGQARDAGGRRRTPAARWPRR